MVTDFCNVGRVYESDDFAVVMIDAILRDITASTTDSQIFNKLTKVCFYVSFIYNSDLSSARKFEADAETKRLSSKILNGLTCHEYAKRINSLYCKEFNRLQSRRREIRNRIAYLSKPRGCKDLSTFTELEQTRKHRQEKLFKAENEFTSIQSAFNSFISSIRYSAANTLV